MQSEKKHLDDIKGIAKAFTPDEWEVVIGLIPNRRLGEELIKRADKGQEIFKQMSNIWEAENGN